MLLILSRVYKEKWDALGGINGFLAGQVCMFSRLFVCLCYIVCLCVIVCVNLFVCVLLFVLTCLYVSNCLCVIVCV